ncbi:MAG: L-fucose:H+ symporter permease [Verrucomicrobiota bacterium]
MNKPKIVPSQLLIPFILVTSMFFMWGLANNMTDILVASFKRIMSLTDLVSTLIQFSFYGAYFCLALPAALLIRKFEYKSGILVGLGMFILGALLFYPASLTMEYSHFLAALFILAGGLSVLETTANPYILAMGDESNQIQRLNFAQSFNPIGSMTGILLGKFFILSQLDTASEADRAAMSAEELEAVQAGELTAVMGPYVGVAFVLLIIWVMIAVRKMPKGTVHDSPPALSESFRRLAKNKNYRLGVGAQFFAVGAQIATWSFLIRYVMKQIGCTEDVASNYYVASLALFIACRFLFTWLLSKFKAGHLLGASAIVAVISIAIAVTIQGMVGVIALVIVSGCMSLMFPTIFGIATVGTEDDHKIASSGLIMAIVGGAVMTPLQGALSDHYGVELSYLVPLACFCYVVFYGFSRGNLHQSTDEAA